MNVAGHKGNRMYRVLAILGLLIVWLYAVALGVIYDINFFYMVPAHAIYGWLLGHIMGSGK